MNKIITLNDVRKAKAIPTAKEVKAMDAHDAVMALIRKEHAALLANPCIGKLIRNGKPVYYVNFPEYREDTLENLAGI